MTLIKRHLGIFGITAVFILIGIIWTITQSARLQHPWTQWLVLLILSAALAGFTYYFALREENVKYDYSSGSGVQKGKEIKYGWLIGAWFFYALIIFGVAASTRSQRVDNCIPKEPLSNSVGYIPDTKKYIDFFENCPASKILLDEPAKDYITNTHKLPSWIMTPDGYTSDVVGWLREYSGNPKSPYDLKSMTPEEQQQFFDTRQLPARILLKE